MPFQGDTPQLLDLFSKRDYSKVLIFFPFNELRVSKYIFKSNLHTGALDRVAYIPTNLLNTAPLLMLRNDESGLLYSFNSNLFRSFVIIIKSARSGINFGGVMIIIFKSIYGIQTQLIIENA